MKINDFRASSLIAVLRETLRGKTIGRTLTNLALAGIVIDGKILDVGGGEPRASHYRFFKLVKNAAIETVNIVPETRPTYLADVDKESLPIPDENFDTVFMFNILEHLAAPQKALSEAHRVLKSDGCLVGSVPFLVNVHADPNDYYRYTSEALIKMLKDEGYSDIRVESIGWGPWLAAYSQIEFLIPRFLAIVAVPWIYLLDKITVIVGRKKQNLREKYPVAYLFTAKKPKCAP